METAQRQSPASAQRLQSRRKTLGLPGQHLIRQRQKVQAVFTPLYGHASIHQAFISRSELCINRVV